MFGNIFIFIAYGLKFSKELNLKRIFEKDISPKTIKKSRSTKKHISPFVTNSNFIFPSLELLEKPKKNPSIDIENKKLEFSIATDGTIGLESLFGVINSVLDLETSIKALTSNPRHIFGQETYSIQKNYDANLTLFNPKESYIFSKEDILSTSKNSVFIGHELRGKVYGIYSNKKLVLR